MSDMPERIRVGQDSEGFWTCREAVSGSQEYIRADKLEELAAERQGVISNIPMDYLQRHDASGATGPTANLNLVAAVRDYAEDRWKLIDRLAEAKRENEALREALSKIIAKDSCIDASPRGGRKIIYGDFAKIARNAGGTDG